LTRIKSPFSSAHNWAFKPVVPSGNDLTGIAPLKGKVEAAGLRAIGIIGVIGSVQMKRLYGWKPRKIRKMVVENKLVQHRLLKNRYTIPVYTLGQRAAELLQFRYEPHEWFSLTPDDVVRRLVCFQFCCALHGRGKTFRILKTDHPFSCEIEINNDRRHVLVIGQRADVSFHSEGRSLIVIAETMEQVSPLNSQLMDSRLLLHEDLYPEYRFYRQISGEWVR
jgi:hypothetical protein